MSGTTDPDLRGGGLPPLFLVFRRWAEKENHMKDLMKRFWNDESGQGLVEYALIIALVSIGLILVLIAFRNAIGGVFQNITTELNSAGPNQMDP